MLIDSSKFVGQVYQIIELTEYLFGSTNDLDECIKSLVNSISMHLSGS